MYVAPTEGARRLASWPTATGIQREFLLANLCATSLHARRFARYNGRVCERRGQSGTVNLTGFAKAIVNAVFGEGPPQPYHARTCQGRQWRREFPDARNREVDVFLGTLARALSYPAREKLKLRPDDAVYQVYRARCRLAGWAGAREHERLSRLMEKRYHVAVDDLWTKTLTLGELFEATRATASIGRKDLRAEKTSAPPPKPTLP